MKRFRTWLFDRVVVLSLAGCIFWLALLPFSFFRDLAVVRTNQQSSGVFKIVNGYLVVTYQSGPGLAPLLIANGSRLDSWQYFFESPYPGVPVQWKLPLWPSHIYVNRIGWATQLVTVPLWVFALISGIPWAYRIAWNRLHRRAEGLCQVCGYDLRATPNRCPECGTIPLTAKIISS